MKGGRTVRDPKLYTLLIEAIKETQKTEQADWTEWWSWGWSWGTLRP